MANSIVIPVRRGDTVTRTFVLKDDAGDPIDLTGSVVRMNIRIDVLDGVLALASGSGLTVSAADGEVTMTLTEAQTKQLKQGSKSDFELKHRSGGVQTTVLVGAFNVTEAINADD